MASNDPQLDEVKERPYKFCSDEFEGNLDCKVWDMGASQQEIVNNVIDLYKNYYVFNAYKRGRLAWSVDSYLSRLSGRYFHRFSEAFQFSYFSGHALSGSSPADHLSRPRCSSGTVGPWTFLRSGSSARHVSCLPD